jgi:hypothetical protein
MTSLHALLGATLLALAPIGAAQAQFGGMGGGGAPAPAAQRPPPPPALPGLQQRRGLQPVPAQSSPATMNPNDALFDGIARGDLETVRDAVNRGADLRARSALGLNPIDAAVDQGRPEVTFYLLSVRGGAGMASQGPPPGFDERRGARGQREQVARERPEPAPRPERAQPAPRVPVLAVSTHGGQAIPSIGFLGFDPRR